MAKMMEPRFKTSRRLGVNVCGHPKAMKRASAAFDRSARKLSNYGLQLLEKQRLRAYYNVMERQFKGYVEKAMKHHGVTGEVLVQLLETRLDNLVYRMGLAHSIRQSRQMVNHGHVLLNGSKVTIPSHAVNPGDVITLREKSRQNEHFVTFFQEASYRSYPYLEILPEAFGGRLIHKPQRQDIPIEVNDQLVVEYYSK